MKISTSGGGAAYSSPAVANPLTARMHKGINTTADEGQTPIIQHGGGFDGADVAHALRGEGFDASEDGTGRGTPIVPVQHAIAIQERAVSENPDAGPDGKGWRDDGAAYTLEARQVTQAVAAPVDSAFTAKDHGGDAVEGVIPAIAFAHQAGGKQTTLGATDDGTCQTLGACQTPAVAYQQAEPFTIMERGRDGQSNLESRQDGTANAILTPNGGRGGLGVGAIAAAWGVRRLTPREAERLMGFPDDFTLIPWRGKPAEDCPDGNRYKALGNSIAVNVAAWIGERIEAVRAVEVKGAKA